MTTPIGPTNFRIDKQQALFSFAAQNLIAGHQRRKKKQDSIRHQFAMGKGKKVRSSLCGK
jgi:hypothetical protein